MDTWFVLPISTTVIITIITINILIMFLPAAHPPSLPPPHVQDAVSWTNRHGKYLKNFTPKVYPLPPCEVNASIVPLRLVQLRRTKKQDVKRIMKNERNHSPVLLFVTFTHVIEVSLITVYVIIRPQMFPPIKISFTPTISVPGTATTASTIINIHGHLHCFLEYTMFYHAHGVIVGENISKMARVDVHPLLRPVLSSVMLTDCPSYHHISNNIFTVKPLDSSRLLPILILPTLTIQ
mmetsp:Transcript_21101/g.29567  ORF Transcript_21101/g.29567 Transcript_21101/m.29567 type:complete len:237 (+) Transcript_21101:1107-1817(+)